MTPVDIQNLADVIASWPLQITIEVDHKKYLLAHAMTSAPGIEKPLMYYLMGSELNQSYLKTVLMITYLFAVIGRMLIIRSGKTKRKMYI